MNIDHVTAGSKVLVGNPMDPTGALQIGVVTKVWHYQGSPRVSMVQVQWGFYNAQFSNGDPPELTEDDRTYFTCGDWVIYPDPVRVLRIELRRVLYKALPVLFHQPEPATVTQGLVRLAALRDYQRAYFPAADGSKFEVPGWLDALLLEFSPPAETPIPEYQDSAMVGAGDDA